MLRHFGRLIWKQSRDISVLNYPQYMVYEIYTNQGFLYISHNKDNDKLELLDGFSQSYTANDFAKLKANQSKEIYLPPLK